MPRVHFEANESKIDENRPKPELPKPLPLSSRLKTTARDIAFNTTFQGEYKISTEKYLDNPLDLSLIF
jgi:hypothetical protein